ncbi:hypothetical protein BGZ61DRAFT_374385 [Ilyonectria robusta]|uniref:uncharacterized protein n=1 Tax=Ilyonectria robusta TaxID=1079257 RepID=UPI001E8D7C02|nr:uncharacterized protein BGZ61DRAFT_374385 [Ilyonectria robusta]KAH8652985.1 hypothetical protein BGZ61DRAFT_374385 [Ilyonectria robusta]
MKVAIVGAAGETGSCIVNALLQSNISELNITALTRPASLGKPEVEELRKKGVSVVAADLVGSEDQLVKILSGTDVLISTVSVTGLLDQIPLADAAKVAGVKRFVPCFFATIAPPKGVLDLRYLKEEILLHVKKIHLPYTVIDVGWWYQLSLPRLPSGRIDYAVTMPVEYIAGDGNAPSALTDMRDVGNYTARIIRDPRTLNKMVLVYGEVLSQNQVFDLLENLSGEQLERHYRTADDLKVAISKPLSHDWFRNALDHRETVISQYWNSMGIRGENTPEFAHFLGYLDGKNLYPDFEGISLETCCREILEGKAAGVYLNRW